LSVVARPERGLTDCVPSPIFSERHPCDRKQYR
jgi:hypothetical protein